MTGMTEGPSVPDPLSDRSLFAETLRRHMDSAQVSATELAKRVGTNKTSVGRWRTGEDRPRPAYVVKIADALGLDRWTLLQQAGYAQADNAQPVAPIDPFEAALRARVDEMREAVQGTPREFWAAIIKATFDRAIDGARDMAMLLSESNAPRRTLRTRGDSPIRTTGTSHKSRPKGNGEELSTLHRLLRPLLAT